MFKNSFRKTLSIPGLIKEVRTRFDKFRDIVPSRGLTLCDCLMSGLAIFGLKYPSLLQFDHYLDDKITRANLASLYGIKNAPSDTYLRERLDEVDPVSFRSIFKHLMHLLQRGKGLEGFEFFNHHYLLSIDGTGYFESTEIHCDQCCEKHHRNGKTTYYHQMLSAALVNPDHKEVFVLAPEPILQQDGHTKNDCERNAAKRLLMDLRREHPHMKLIIIEDGLSSNAPHIRLLKELNLHFILGAKPGDHEYLFNWVDNATTGVEKIDLTDERAVTHRFRYMNNVPLNESNSDLKVNFLEYWEIPTSGKFQHFSWVVDFTITQDNLMILMRGGRARWKIENETFNTLKNQGYNFEHNFGHGYKHLTTVFVYLMMLAFLIDQIQQRCCPLFKEALQAAKRKLYFWDKVRRAFFSFLIPDWGTLYKTIIKGVKPIPIAIYDSS